MGSSSSTYGYTVFGGCTQFATLTIGNNVTCIPNYAFIGCSSLTGELIIPNSVTRIGGNVPVVKPGQYWAPDYFQLGEAIGANWFFGDTFGLNLEFGYPFTKFGVTFKF